jgi:hypothetical protein
MRYNDKISEESRDINTECNIAKDKLYKNHYKQRLLKKLVIICHFLWCF